MNTSNTLITGATGLLGPYLAEAAAAHGSVTRLARHDGDISCDLCNFEAIADVISDLRPATVLHAAAFTDVDGCEREPGSAERINHLATVNLVRSLPDDTCLNIFYRFN